MGKLYGKVAVITGGSSGIGRASASLFAREGAKVVIAARGTESGEETVRMIREAGGEAVFVKTDVSKAADVKSMIKIAIDNYGQLDILFNNAGFEGELGYLHELTEENWDRVIDGNLKGVFLGMKYGIPEMLKRGGGVIVNTASTAGLGDHAYMSVYCASKGGVIRLTMTAALEYASQNIRINCICPGGILTPMVERISLDEEVCKRARWLPIGRLGTPEEAAQAALFLASSESSFITGACLPVDGGFAAA